jgi:hypothetical protein
MLQPFDGIAEKLYRSKENIVNLETEIGRFFQESEYPVLSDDNKKLIPEALQYHRDRPVPLRFALLAGEVVHHLRSILDHIVWQFSDPTYREAHPRWIEFPVLETRPPEKDLFTSYTRKIKGVTNPVVRDLIEGLQPYSSDDPIDSPLLIIHNFDVIDKHRELVITVSTPAFEFPAETAARYARYKSGEPGSPPVDLMAEFQRDGKIVPQIAFSEFGRSKSEPIVQGLNELQNSIVYVVAAFDKLR